MILLGRDPRTIMMPGLRAGWSPRFLIAVILIAVMAGVLSCTRPATPGGLYYYSQGQRIELELDPHRIALRFEPTMADSVVLYFQTNPLLTYTSNMESYQNERVVLGSLSAVGESLGVAAVHDSIRTEIGSPSSPVEFVGIVVLLQASQQSLVVSDRIVARFREGVSQSNRNAALAALKLEVDPATPEKPQQVVLRVRSGSPLEAIHAANRLYERHDLVVFSHPDFIVPTRKTQQAVGCDTNDRLLTDQWYVRKVEATRAWCISKGSAQVRIAVVDDAVEVNHPDLYPSVVPPAAGDYRDLISMDLDPSPMIADEWHGTRTAGLAAATGGNTDGIAGLCPECKLLPFRTLGGSISQYPLTFVEADEQGAAIISNSWTFTRAAVFDNVVTCIEDLSVSGRQGKGIVFVFSTESGDVAGSIADLECVLAVGRSKQDDQRSVLSAQGPELDLLAPGINIVTTAPRVGTPPGNANPMPDDGYDQAFSGSSASAPIVAGVAGLVLSVNSQLHASDVRQLLCQTAEKVHPALANYDASGFSLTYGYGRVDAFEAVKAALCFSAQSPPAPPPVTIGSLWLAMLLSSLAVCIVSLVIWRLIGYHASDYAVLPTQAAAEAALVGVARGEYRTGTPLAFVRVLPGGLGSFWLRLLVWFLFCIAVAVFIAYVGSRTLPHGTSYMGVFRIAGTIGWLAHGAAVVPDAIWAGRRPWNVLKLVFDALIYALVTAGFFGWLWPR